MLVATIAYQLVVQVVTTSFSFVRQLVLQQCVNGAAVPFSGLLWLG